ncbi:hypothetical protein [Emcibacter sp.]|uniref:hypothetical protein n=1 Tax=Emcibacter sp. TaxID=1979954 RepID=UPI003A920DE8
MTNTEKQSLVTLIGTGIVFYLLLARMLSGGQIVDYEMKELFFIYGQLVTSAVVLIVVGTVVFRIVQTILEQRSAESEELELDERDIAISARANRNEVIFYGLAINILIICQFLAAYFPDNTPAILTVSTSADLVFMLFSMLVVATMVKEVSRLIYYRL